MSIKDGQSMNESLNKLADSSNMRDDQEQKKYSNIMPQVRLAFIKKVLSRQCTIKEASEEFGIKFSTSKAILQTFKREGRIGKKKTRLRNKKSSRTLEEEQPKESIKELEPKQLPSTRKRLCQKPEELQIALKKMEQELGLVEPEQKPEVNKPEETQEKTQNQLNNSNYQLMLMQQQLANIQMQNQMLQQYFQCNNPLLMQFQLELQKQKQINTQLMDIIQYQNQLFQQPIPQKPQIDMRIQSAKSLQDFGQVKEEEDKFLYVTPLQSMKNLEKIPNNIQFPFEYKGTLRDF